MDYIQIVTWNDYGEGTMIELTREFGYTFLTLLQEKLGVKHNQADLEQVTKICHQRKYNSANATRLDQLEQEFYTLVNLKPNNA
jgi:hypothetical protein